MDDDYILTNGVWFYSLSAADPVHKIGPWTKLREDADVMTHMDAERLVHEWRRRLRLRIVAVSKLAQI
jgi:hypothetical protein